MTDALNHGPRLSQEEYERQIIALHSGLPPCPSKEQDLRVRRKELDLAVDHRLGRDFPQERREALWAIQQRIERKRLRLMFKHLLKRLFARGLTRDAQNLAAYLVDEYATVLTEAELDAFFGADESRNPALPIESGQP
jgi:hypothetical protein